MANSKLRCRSCKDYAPREQFADHPGYCSAECVLTARTKPPKPPKRTTSTPRKTRRLSPTLQKLLRERDGHRCRWCGKPSPLASHHVRYRSEGGADEEWNLLTLCNDHCHPLAHSNKRLYQPLLLTVLWLEYFHGVHLTVPQVEGWLESLGG